MDDVDPRNDDQYRGDPPAYGPPGYGPPGYGPPPGYALRRQTNPMAIVALVLSCLGALAPVGMVLGIVARGQIRRTGEQGDGLALAAIIVGGIATTVMVVGLLLVILMVASIDGSAAG
jgi:hypothetical protein